MVEENLVIGEIYYTIMPEHLQWESLHLCTNKDSKNQFSYRLYVSDDCKSNRFNTCFWCFTKDIEYRLATSEEKHWLNECIKANKFIPFNELKFNKIYELW